MRSLLIIVFIVAMFAATTRSYAACSSPVGAAGEFAYFSASSSYKFCDGSRWYWFNNAATLTACTTAGQLEYDTTISAYKFCNGTNWIKVDSPAIPTGCGTIGNTCSDGSIYAGVSADGGAKMYVAPTDAPTTLSWNNGTTSYPSSPLMGALRCDVGTELSCTTGFDNTVFFASVSSTDSPLQAVTYCNNLTTGGRLDWYLPSRDELDTLYANRAALSLASANFWSSSEYAAAASRKKHMNPAVPATTSTKISAYNIRCARKDSLSTCTTAGALNYSGAGFLQYCNGTNWILMGPRPDPCNSVSVTAGTTCLDGTVYAGNSPDGGGMMFVTPADAPSNLSWNNGNTSGYVQVISNICYNTGELGCRTGRLNSSEAASSDSNTASGGVQPHQAAAYCENLVANDSSDWYLPSLDELGVMYGNRNAGSLSGTFGTVYPNNTYWSSSEPNANSAYTQAFDANNKYASTKENQWKIRCVRRY